MTRIALGPQDRFHISVEIDLAGVKESKCQQEEQKAH